MEWAKVLSRVRLQNLGMDTVGVKSQPISLVWTECGPRMAGTFEKSKESVMRYPSQLSVVVQDRTIGRPRSTIITTRGFSGSQTATRTTTTRTMPTRSGVCGDEASLLPLFLIWI